MTTPGVLQMRWLTTPVMADPIVRQQILECWRDVSNAGGAVGFPFPPVTYEQVRSSLERMVQSLDEPANRLLPAALNDQLAGWLFLAGNSSELTAHWARILRVQTALGFRRRGVGRALMTEVALQPPKTWPLTICALNCVQAWALKTSTSHAVGRKSGVDQELSGSRRVTKTRSSWACP